MYFTLILRRCAKCGAFLDHTTHGPAGNRHRGRAHSRVPPWPISWWSCTSSRPSAPSPGSTSAARWHPRSTPW